MNDETDFEATLSVALRAMAHPARLTILRYLAGKSGQCCCAEVSCCLPLAQSTVSQHLKVLLEAGLIERHPQGTRNRYAIRAGRLAEVRASLDGVFDAFAPAGGRPAEPRPGMNA